MHLSNSLFYIIVFCIFSVVSIGCSRDNFEPPIYEIEALQKADITLNLSISDTFTIKLDHETSPNNFIDQLAIVDFEPLYFLYNSDMDRIQVYDIKSGNKVKSIQLQNEGPDMAILSESFYFHNWDSIFVLHSKPNIIYLIDSSGTRIDYWDVNPTGQFLDYSISTSDLYKPYFDKSTNRVGFWIYPPLEATVKEYYRGVSVAEFNLDGQSFEKVFGHYPRQYLIDDNVYFPIEMVHGYASDSYNVLYFLGSSELHLYDRTSKKLLRAIDAKSNYISGDIEPLMKDGEQDPELEEQSNYLITSPYYPKMFANDDYTYHYRIAKHRSELNYDDGGVRDFDDKPFSIMVLDKDFRLINEIEFDSDSYNFFQCFAFQNKLYLSTNNSLNESMSEDYLEFVVFELTEEL